MSNLPIRGRIENWMPVQEVEGIVIFGRIYEDPRHDPDTTAFQDGHRILTSQVRAVESNHRQIKTIYSRYTLGKLSPEYLEKLQQGAEDLIPELDKLPIYYLHPITGEEL